MKDLENLIKIVETLLIKTMENETTNATISAKKTQYVSQGWKTKRCGHAVVAMITNESIEDLCKEFKKDLSLSLINDIQPYLENRGYDTKYIKVRSFAEIPNDAIVFIEYPDVRNGHFSLKKDDIYYDPHHGKMLEYNAELNLPHSYLQFTKRNNL